MEGLGCLCPFTEVEPETLPRPWLLSFMQQVLPFSVWGRKEGASGGCGVGQSSPYFSLKLTKFFCL